MKFVLFIDALDPRDVATASPAMANDMKGAYEVGVPRVTPNVVPQAMTGLPAEDMEMMRSTPLFEPDESTGFVPNRDGDDPWQSGERRIGIHPYDNILEDLDDEGIRVFQYGTPFCATVEIENGLSVHDEMTNPAAPAFMNFAMPQSSFMNDEWDLIADIYIDDTRLNFISMKQLTRQDVFDVIFLGYKHIDHATHWFAPDIKRDLITLIWSFIEELRALGHDVMWWSDHGSQAKTGVFRINKWLAEHGYLDLDVDAGFLEQAIEKGIVNQQFDEQLTLQSPFVDVDWSGSVAFCSDAFDALVDVVPGTADATIDRLVDELGAHPAIENTWRKADYYDPDGDRFWYAPEVIVERAPGVLVTGNVHPAADTWVDDVPDDWQEWPEDNMGMRPGVHSKFGCYGGDVDAVTIDYPWQLRDVMWEFIEPDSIDAGEAEEPTSREHVPDEQLEALGYL